MRLHSLLCEVDISGISAIIARNDQNAIGRGCVAVSAWLNVQVCGLLINSLRPEQDVRQRRLQSGYLSHPYGLFQDIRCILPEYNRIAQFPQVSRQTVIMHDGHHLDGLIQLTAAAGIHQGSVLRRGVGNAGKVCVFLQLKLMDLG